MQKGGGYLILFAVCLMIRARIGDRTLYYIFWVPKIECVSHSARILIMYVVQKYSRDDNNINNIILYYRGEYINRYDLVFTRRILCIFHVRYNIITVHQCFFFLANEVKIRHIFRQAQRFLCFSILLSLFLHTIIRIYTFCYNLSGCKRYDDIYRWYLKMVSILNN